MDICQWKHGMHKENKNHLFTGTFVYFIDRYDISMAEQFYPLTFEDREINHRMLGGLGLLDTSLYLDRCKVYWQVLLSILLTGTIFEVTFRGNVRFDERYQPASKRPMKCFNSQIPCQLVFFITEADKHLQKNYDFFKVYWPSCSWILCLTLYTESIHWY